MSSENYEANGYGHDLDLLVYLSQVGKLSVADTSLLPIFGEMDFHLPRFN